MFQVILLVQCSTLFFEYNVPRYSFSTMFHVILLVQCSVLFFQYNVRAVDQGSPALTSQSIPVTINVLRNNQPPIFINEPYSQDITTGFFQGASIIRVTANDNDISVSIATTQNTLPYHNFYLKIWVYTNTKISYSL